MSTPSQTVGPYLAIGLPWEDGPDVVPEGTPGAVWVWGTVFDGALPAGEHPLFWDLRDRSGGRVGPGLYFLDVRAGAFHATRRLIVVH